MPTVDYLALSDNGFLFDTRNGNTYNLSKTGTFILRSLVEGVAPDAVAARIVEHFDIEAATAEQDAAQFLFRLKDMGLIGGDLGDEVNS